ncbi:MAG: hypothetical protein IT462_04250 [Planctomycetes bacterium]|nr:hypothetical protein [Planctomycetota bacterium]
MRPYWVTKILLCALGLVLAGCQDNSELKRTLAETGDKVALLEHEVDKLSTDNTQLKRAVSDASEEARTARADARDAKNRLATLEAQPGTGGPVRPSESTPGKALTADEISALVQAELNKRASDKAADDQARHEATAAEQTKKMEAIAAKAKEYGLEFDPKDPQGSFKRIMSDPQTRRKAMDAARTEARNQRFAQLGLDERQSEQLTQIENDTRKQIDDLFRQGLQNGQSFEDTQRQVEQAFSDANTRAKNVLTADQFKTYTDLGGAQAAGLPGPGGGGDLSKLFPGIAPEQPFGGLPPGPPGGG